MGELHEEGEVGGGGATARHAVGHVHVRCVWVAVGV